MAPKRLLKWHLTKLSCVSADWYIEYRFAIVFFLGRKGKDMNENIVEEKGGIMALCW